MENEGKGGTFKNHQCKICKAIFFENEKKTNKIGYQTKTDLNLHYDVGLVY